MIRLALFALGIGLTCSGLASGGKFNKKLSPGDPAPAWKDLIGTDDKKHSLDDWKDKDVLVVVFTCNTCPVAVDYEDRIIAFATDHASPTSKVGFVAINVNTVKGDTLPDMKARAAKKKYPFPYLYDPTQEIAKSFGAIFTPEFFVLDKARKVVYMGAMDDKTPPTAPTTKYLEDAVTAALAGKKPAVAETAAAAGCRIRWAAKKEED